MATSDRKNTAAHRIRTARERKILELFAPTQKQLAAKQREAEIIKERLSHARTPLEKENIAFVIFWETAVQTERELTPALENRYGMMKFVQNNGGTLAFHINKKQVRCTMKTDTHGYVGRGQTIKEAFLAMMKVVTNQYLN